jgi:CRISPR-associated endonuclease/helicase Cas3
MQLVIKKHGVLNDNRLSPLQHELLNCDKRVRIADAPTGAGKSYAFQWAMLHRQQRILFIVPTRRLAQNLAFSLKTDLRKAGWDEAKVNSKVAIWSSDTTRQLQEANSLQKGEITIRRLREVYELDETRAGGEIIFAIPEVVSYLLLRRFQTTGQAETGVFDFLGQFDHIVFDEFHTIDPRGFGMAALFAKLAAGLQNHCRAKISFLSATPLNIKPVLLKLETPVDQIAELTEQVTSTDSGKERIIHGNVTLRLVETESLAKLIIDNLPKIQQEIQQKHLVVAIYNNLGNLQRQRSQLAANLEKIGIRREERLLINSIDDSRLGEEAEFEKDFTVGRYKNPNDFKILIATSSVEMGVNFDTRLLLMEPGFEALNFVQRYGRAARGDIEGEVMVRWDTTLYEKMEWLRRLLKWVKPYDGKEIEIQALTNALKRSASERFETDMLDNPNCYGDLPNRAVHTAALYWLLLSKQQTNNRYAQQRLFENSPPPVKLIAGLLTDVRKMEQCQTFGKVAKKWCDRFEDEARTLRNISKRIEVVEENGSHVWITEEFLERETHVLERGILQMDAEGNVKIHITGTFRSHFRDEKQYKPNNLWVTFPHEEGGSLLENIQSEADLITKWCETFEKKQGGSARAWKNWEESMNAAKKLVKLTRLIVSREDHSEWDTQYGVV